MGIFRDTLLWGSENTWLRERFPKYQFAQKAVKKFMPGETLSEAISAAGNFKQDKIPTVFTHLGENIVDLSEAKLVAEHYINALGEIAAAGNDTEVSLKLTQIGFDLSVNQTYENFKNIAVKAKELGNFVWIDMEGSKYTDITIDFYKRAKTELQNIGLCLQAYYMRTEKDIYDLLKIDPAVRLVKGAYNEPPSVAFQKKSDVDRNYMKLSTLLLEEIKSSGNRAAFATHDEEIINLIIKNAETIGIAKDKLEFQMLYGIKPSAQKRLTASGCHVRVLISYGEAWFPWYMRRLAERPANVTFVLKNMFQK